MGARVLDKELKKQKLTGEAIFSGTVKNQKKEKTKKGKNQKKEKNRTFLIETEFFHDMYKL
jgi:hypothetical protein